MERATYVTCNARVLSYVIFVKIKRWRREEKNINPPIPIFMCFPYCSKNAFIFVAVVCNHMEDLEWKVHVTHIAYGYWYSICETTKLLQFFFCIYSIRSRPWQPGEEVKKRKCYARSAAGLSLIHGRPRGFLIQHRLHLNAFSVHLIYLVCPFNLSFAVWPGPVHVCCASRFFFFLSVFCSPPLRDLLLRGPFSTANLQFKIRYL